MAARLPCKMPRAKPWVTAGLNTALAAPALSLSMYLAVTKYCCPSSKRLRVRPKKPGPQHSNAGVNGHCQRNMGLLMPAVFLGNAVSRGGVASVHGLSRCALNDVVSGSTKDLRKGPVIDCWRRILNRNLKSITKSNLFVVHVSTGLSREGWSAYFML